MSDHDLTGLLERAVEPLHVGPPPLTAMLDAGRRGRRRRTITRSLTAAVVLAVVALGATTLPGVVGDAGRGAAPVALPSGGPSVPTNSETDLDGTWTVHALVGADGRSVLPATAVDGPQLTFADGELTGSTGCNSLFGNYAQRGPGDRDLVFARDELGSTLAGCTDEPPLLERLLDVRHVSGAGDTRYLHADTWMIIAELRRG